MNDADSGDFLNKGKYSKIYHVAILPSVTLSFKVASISFPKGYFKKLFYAKVKTANFFFSPTLIGWHYLVKLYFEPCSISDLTQLSGCYMRATLTF